ncbi:hypothetical protein [Streptomyces sp. ISL-10]|uniref:hypothetical protein n=1 Tax=Streptomyces sp. ISL-10 TaxID=2819172 RepID=UPI002034AC4A|nr:hypothetical protein [Streptomyces sp. ISL-10]
MLDHDPETAVHDATRGGVARAEAAAAAVRGLLQPTARHPAGGRRGPGGGSAVWRRGDPGGGSAVWRRGDRGGGLYDGGGTMAAIARKVGYSGSFALSARGIGPQEHRTGAVTSGA